VETEQEQQRPGVRLSIPGYVDAPFAGGARFVAYCMTADARAKNRRNSIKRAGNALRRAERDKRDAYPVALFFAQRMGVALEDLGRLAIGLEAIPQGDAFDALRAAKLDDIDRVFARLMDEPTLRRALHIATASDGAELPQDLQPALLAASDALARRWSGQWRSCAAGWPLLRRIAKCARHGAPLVSREIVLEPPGSGALGKGTPDRFARWVLVTDTEVEGGQRHIKTDWVQADLSGDMLRRAEAAVLDGIELGRGLAEAHVNRVQTASKWAVPGTIVRTLPPDLRKTLREHAL
jgi:hypothetical protein